MGSQKKQKALKSQAANRVDINHVIGAGEKSAVVHQILKGVGMSESNKLAIEEIKNSNNNQNDADAEQERKEKKSANEIAVEKARKTILPEYDEEAAQPSKVYSAKKIAGDRAWSRIHRKVTACLH